MQCLYIQMSEEGRLWVVSVQPPTYLKIFAAIFLFLQDILVDRQAPNYLAYSTCI